MLSAAFLFAILDGLIKLLDPSFRIWDIAFYRFACGIFILTAVFGRQGNPFNAHNPRLLIIRGITGSITFLTLLCAIRLIPISSAIMLFYSFPAFSALFSPLLFKENISKEELACVGLAFCGVAVLLDAKLEGALLGQLMGVAAAAFAGLTVAIIKKLREKNGPVIIYLFFCLLGSAITFPAFIADPQFPLTNGDWLMVSGIVASSTLAQLLMNHGFRYCKSWEGGLFLTTEVIFVAIFGFVFLREDATWRFWAGGILILGSIVFLNHISLRKVSLSEQ
jgi:drug/metabolite transporter (DMT)-like permease